MYKVPPPLALTLTFVGCTVGPDYVAPMVDSPGSWRIEFEEAKDLTNTAWWELFGDPVLDDLILTALQENKDIRIAAARVEEFAARVGIADAASLPQVFYGASGFRDRASQETAIGVPPGVDRTSEFYDATINVGWELDIWGRIRRASEAARAELLAAD